MVVSTEICIYFAIINKHLFHVRNWVQKWEDVVVSQIRCSPCPYVFLNLLGWQTLSDNKKYVIQLPLVKAFMYSMLCSSIVEGFNWRKSVETAVNCEMCRGGHRLGRERSHVGRGAISCCWGWKSLKDWRRPVWLEGRERKPKLDR